METERIMEFALGLDLDQGCIYEAGHIHRSHRIDQLDAEPGETVDVEMGECGTVTNAEVGAVILGEEWTMYHVFVEPKDVEGKTDFFVLDEWGWIEA